jgi:hypothetical protein
MLRRLSMPAETTDSPVAALVLINAAILLNSPFTKKPPIAFVDKDRNPKEKAADLYKTIKENLNIDPDNPAEKKYAADALAVSLYEIASDKPPSSIPSYGEAIKNNPSLANEHKWHYKKETVTIDKHKKTAPPPTSANNDDAVTEDQAINRLNNAMNEEPNRIKKVIEEILRKKDISSNNNAPYSRY